MFPSTFRAWLTRLNSIYLALLVFLTALAILRNPAQMFATSLHVFDLWWHQLFPLLLPYAVLIFSLPHLKEKVHPAMWIDTAVIGCCILQEPPILIPILLAHFISLLLLFLFTNKTVHTQHAAEPAHSFSLGPQVSEGIQLAVHHLFQLVGWMVAAAMVWLLADFVGVWTVLPDSIPLFFVYGLIDAPLGLALLTQSVISVHAFPLTIALCSAIISWSGLTNVLRIATAGHVAKLVQIKLLHGALSFGFCFLFFYIFRS